MGVVTVTRGESPIASPFSIVCFSSQDWHTLLPTNRQQIMSRAARRGHRVLFVETGRFAGRHLWRAVRSRSRAAAQRLVRGEDVAAGVRVCKLLNVLPFGQRYALVNSLNWRIGGFLARREARRLPEPRVAWIYDPRGAEAVGTFGEAFAVYDCVDDYAEQAAYSARSRELVRAADRTAGVRARLVFATTRSLFERHASQNARTYLVPNVGDFEHFAAAADRRFAEPELLELQRPVLGFAGNLVVSKLDFELLAELARTFAPGTLLLVGPVERQARESLARLDSLANVRWVGPRSYTELPRAVAAFDVALIPYLENEYTRSCFPLKLYEYLAAGKQVVATGLPELVGLEPHVVVAWDGDAAVRAIGSALARGAAGRAERQALAARNTWDTRTSRLLDLVESELGELTCVCSS
jgi:glycosyltransferase involved in cell wall biosynthesis